MHQVGLTSKYRITIKTLISRKFSFQVCTFRSQCVPLITIPDKTSQGIFLKERGSKSMSAYLSNNQKLLQEGVKWVRSEYECLVILQVAGLGAISSPYYRNMTSTQLRQIATFRVDEILKALEGGSFDDEAAKQRFYSLLEQGIKLSELTAGADVL